MTWELTAIAVTLLAWAGGFLLAYTWRNHDIRRLLAAVYHARRENDDLLRECVRAQADAMRLRRVHAETIAAMGRYEAECRANQLHLRLKCTDFALDGPAAEHGGAS
jgi:hypothetical protein